MHQLNGRPVIVLLVEDNPAHAELVVRQLQDHQIANTIYHVTDGEHALAFLQREGAYTNPEDAPRPDVVLLDLRLPKIDGIEVLKCIKDDVSLQKIPVVMLTTSKAEEDLMSAYRHHVNSYLVKPVDFDAFRELMGNLGFYWLMWNQKPNCET